MKSFKEITNNEPDLSVSLGHKSKIKRFSVSEAFNIAIVNPKDFDLVPTSANRGELEALLKQFSYITSVPIAAQPDGKKFKIRKANDEDREKVKDWIELNAPSLKPIISFGNGSVGDSGVKVSENTQELMVSCLCLLNKQYTTLKHPDTNDLIKLAEGKYTSVIGSKERMDLLDQFAGNYDDLATAVSSSNAILKIVGTPSKVFWTGKGWDSEIAGFNPPNPNIKDYNSSDIVVLGADGIYYGFSLKKKARSKEKDPTLINKPITGDKSFLQGIISVSDLAKIETAKEKFFDQVIIKQYPKESIKKLNDTAKGKLIRDISPTKMGTYLKSPDNKFFKTADRILRQGGGHDFAMAFMEQIFRVNLEEVESTGKFKFYLLTGIGKNGKEELSIESAEVKDLPSTIEALSKVFAKGLSTKVTKGKKQAWDAGAGAAKIFHTIYSGTTPLVEIEIRYKGSYTANPQFQASATPVFKSLFN